MGRSRGGKSSGAHHVEAEDTDGVPSRIGAPGSESEDHLVTQVIDFLSQGPQEMQILSSHFAVRFNHAVRNAPNSPYNPNKKNDGSFKKWLVWWGFEVSATYERNKSMISIPSAGLPWAPAKPKARDRAQASKESPKKEEEAPVGSTKDDEEEYPYVVEEPTSSAGPFKPPHGRGTEEAREMEVEAISYIRSRGPLDIGALRQVNDLGARFNALFFHRPRVNDGSWKRWLVSLPDVEIVTDPVKSQYHCNQPTLVRMRKTARSAAQPPVPSRAELEGRNLLEALRDGAAAKAGSAGEDTAASRRASGEAAIAAAAAEGASEETEPLDPEDVPTYVFLDSSATLRMMESEAGMFTFQGLMNLCRQGRMKCSPVDDGHHLAMQGISVDELSLATSTREQERVVLVMTSSVLEDLPARVRSPQEMSQVEWLKTGADSPLQLCYAWGFLEVLDTHLHRSTMRIGPAQAQRALSASLPQQLVKLLDFIYLWDTQIEVEDRVVFVTADRGMQTFAESVAAEGDVSGRRVSSVHLDDLNDRLRRDKIHGGRELSEACKTLTAPASCSSVFTAATLAAVLAPAKAEESSTASRLTLAEAAASAAGGGVSTATSGPVDSDVVESMVPADSAGALGAGGGAGATSAAAGASADASGGAGDGSRPASATVAARAAGIGAVIAGTSTVAAGTGDAPYTQAAAHAPAPSAAGKSGADGVEAAVDAKAPTAEALAAGRGAAAAPSAEALRLELQRAVELAAEVQRFISAGKRTEAAESTEVESCLERLGDAAARWQLRLASRGPNEGGA